VQLQRCKQVNMGGKGRVCEWVGVVPPNTSPAVPQAAVRQHARGSGTRCPPERGKVEAAAGAAVRRQQRGVHMQRQVWCSV